MKNVWQKYLVWREKRNQKHFEWWGKKRSKGHPQIVLSTTFIYLSVMLFTTSIFDYFDGYLTWSALPFKLLKYFIFGFILGLFIWWDNERRYQRVLKAKSVP